MTTMVLGAGQSPRRQDRTPNFSVAGAIKPYGLYPLWAHPVLPGETIQQMTTKLRVVSMPVKHPLAGSWLETWLVYVRLTDIDRNLGQMFVSDAYSTSGFLAAADQPRYFTKTGQVEWIKRAVEKVHNSYFLHGGETMRTIDGVPMVKLNNRSWYENMMFQPTDQAVPTVDASELASHLQGYMMLQQMQMTELTYEAYLAQYGVQANDPKDGDPEILRFSRSWIAPATTIDPVSGKPSGAFVWNEEIKLDKPKKFLEPGFILQLACVRPKMYQGALAYSMLGNLWGFADWFPAYALPDPTSTVKELAKNDPVFAASATDAGTQVLIYDHSDLLAHGEQFLNGGVEPYAIPRATGMNVKTGATAYDVRGQYPILADIDGLFVGANPTDRVCAYEGIAQIRVSGHVGDNTRMVGV